MTEQVDSEGTAELDISQLRPYFSVTILECVIDDVAVAYHALLRYLRKSAQDKGRALTTEVIGETVISADPASESDDGSGEFLASLGFEDMFAIARRRTQVPAWASRDSLLRDTVNELTLVLRRHRLVAIRSDIINPVTLLRWADGPTTPI